MGPEGQKGAPGVYGAEGLQEPSGPKGPKLLRALVLLGLVLGVFPVGACHASGVCSMGAHLVHGI